MTQDEKTSAWISVEDELPATPEFVVVYGRPHVTGKRCVSMARPMWKEWWLESGFAVHVTHWQYFPDPPEVDDVR